LIDIISPSTIVKPGTTFKTTKAMFSVVILFKRIVKTTVPDISMKTSTLLLHWGLKALVFNCCISLLKCKLKWVAPESRFDNLNWSSLVIVHAPASLEYIQMALCLSVKLK